jgi:hypothetical protein
VIFSILALVQLRTCKHSSTVSNMTTLAFRHHASTSNYHKRCKLKKKKKMMKLRTWRSYEALRFNPTLAEMSTRGVVWTPEVWRSNVSALALKPQCVSAARKSSVFGLLLV